jgi:hypothetical protein
VLAGLPVMANATPTALVEEVASEGASVQPLDFVDAGQVIELGARGTLTLGYLASCVHEKIIGGRVTIGIQQSEVRGGSVERTKTPCAGGQLALVADQAMHSGGTAMRGLSPPSTSASAGRDRRATLTVFDVSPLLALRLPVTLTLERVDIRGERHRLEPAPGANTIDLAERGITLARGGRYKLSDGSRTVLIKVDRAAGSGGTPLLGRMIPF